MIRFVARDMDGRVWGYANAPKFNGRMGCWEPSTGRVHRFMKDEYPEIKRGECRQLPVDSRSPATPTDTTEAENERERGEE